MDILPRHSEEKPPVSVVLGGNRDIPSAPSRVKVCRLESLSLCLGLEDFTPLHLLLFQVSQWPFLARHSLNTPHLARIGGVPTIAH